MIVTDVADAVAVTVLLQVHKYCDVPPGTVWLHPSVIACPVSAPELNVNVEPLPGLAGAEDELVLLYICTFAVCVPSLPAVPSFTLKSVRVSSSKRVVVLGEAFSRYLISTLYTSLPKLKLPAFTVWVAVVEKACTWEKLAPLSVDFKNLNWYAPAGNWVYKVAGLAVKVIVEGLGLALPPS